MAIEAILSAQIDDPLTWKQAHLLIDQAGLAISIVDDHPDAAYISLRLGITGLVNKLLGRNDADVDPTDNLSAEFERLRHASTWATSTPWIRSSSSIPTTCMPIATFVRRGASCLCVPVGRQGTSPPYHCPMST
jgi:hypothetical protein